MSDCIKQLKIKCKFSGAISFVLGAFLAQYHGYSAKDGLVSIGNTKRAQGNPSEHTE